MRHRLEYSAVLCFLVIVRILPRYATLRLGSVFGWLFYVLHRRRRQLALDNLQAAFPARTERECRSILRGTFRHFGRHVVELIKFDTMNADEIMSFVEIEGEEHVQQALSSRTGVMYCGSHFGYWELHLKMHSFHYKPLVVVARTLDNPFLERVIEQIRARMGTQVVPRRGAVRGVLKALLKQESVVMMVDQHMQDRSAVIVDFFNRPASTTSALAVLAIRTGVPIIPVFAIPLAGGRYRMIYEAPIEPPASDDPDPVLAYTQRCTDLLEKYVRLYPELWLWMHRRWRLPTPSSDSGA